MIHKLTNIHVDRPTGPNYTIAAILYRKKMGGNIEMGGDLSSFFSSSLKWTYGRPGIDYRVSSLFTRYLTAIGIILESFKSIGQI